MITLTITWNDGSTEKVVCEDFRLDETMLRITISRGSYRYVPLTSIREFTREG